MKYAIEIPPAGSIIMLDGARHYVQDGGNPARLVPLKDNGTLDCKGITAVFWPDSDYTIVRWGPGEIIKETADD